MRPETYLLGTGVALSLALLLGDAAERRARPHVLTTVIEARCGTDAECAALPECVADPTCDGGPVPTRGL